MWDKIPGHERNEALDCRNYALAAFKCTPANLDEIDRRLKAARGKAPSTGVATVPPPPKKQTKRGSALKKYYDEW